ncbi:MAG: OPT family oligopeptide transporter [Kofleriaceae bacterium]|nr:OPT family oligopeptide transporter [Kofleriaceae bacterium]
MAGSADDLPSAKVISAAPDEDPETKWLRETYRPDEPNLTVRGVIAGILIGAVMCLSNIYVFFKTGWSLGVTLTACISAFAVFRLLHWVRLVRRPLGMLENNALTTVASGAGYMTAGGNASAFGALLMITTVRPSQIGMVAWFAVISALGVFAAIPIKRQLINKEALPFPTGTATAETLRLIHGGGGKGDKGSGAVIALAIAGVFGALLGYARDWMRLFKDSFGGDWFTLAGAPIGKWTLSFRAEVVQIGAGALMSWRTGWTLLLGAILNYAVLAPALYREGQIADITYKGILNWTLWPGAAILVGAGLTQFALDYKSLGRAFSGLGSMFDRSKRNANTGIAAVESPEWWFPAGFMILSPLIILLMVIMFQIPWWAAVVALPLAIIMGFVAARVTGETDVTPTKALGPVTQAVYGVITPGNMTGNIMSANVTGGIGLHAADLLTTLKTGWLLGAKPRHQLYAQLFGVLAGSVMIVVMFDLIIDPSVLGTEEWPAPSCAVWAGVSKTFVDGIGSLPESAQIATLVGLALGVAMALIEKFAPKHIKSFLPSAFGLGLGMVVPGSSSIMMFIGAGIAELLRRKAPDYVGYVIPVASGLIAGESLMGSAIQIATRVFGLTPG